MVDTFDRVVVPYITIEGGYTNDPDDHGGETNYGVTFARARAAGFFRDMRTMTPAEAMNIHRLFEWEQPGFDKLDQISPPLAEYCLNIGMNCGSSWPSRWMQRALNVLLPGTPLKVDGVVGRLTRYYLSQYLAARSSVDGEAVILNMMKGQACVRYIEIAEADPSQEKFEYGWQRTRAFAVSQLRGLLS